MARLPEFHAPYRVGTSILKLRAWAHLHIPQMYLNGTLHKVPGIFFFNNLHIYFSKLKLAEIFYLIFNNPYSQPISWFYF